MSRRFTAANIFRSRYSLPYMDPEAREIIYLIPSLLSIGREGFGVYAHPVCTPGGLELLRKHLDKGVDLVPGRLPDRILLESFIIVPRPCISGEYSLSLAIIAIPVEDTMVDEITNKLEEIQGFLRKKGIFATLHVQKRLPELLIYEVMRVGVVLAGKYPITKEGKEEDSIFIGRLPFSIKEGFMDRPMDWNPFWYFLSREILRYIEAGDYPASMHIPGANPYLLPYLHILQACEEGLDADRLARFRTSLYYLFSGFGPTREVMAEQAARWRWNAMPDITEMGLRGRLRLRRWLVPLEAGELPLCIWPPLKGETLDEVRLELKHGLCGIRGVPGFSHEHAWVVLAWAGLSGLIGEKTRIRHTREIALRRDVPESIGKMLEALYGGVDIIVSQDHLKGAVKKLDGRFFFSGDFFAVLGKGDKYCLETEPLVQEKALIDDKGLDKLLGG